MQAISLLIYAEKLANLQLYCNCCIVYYSINRIIKAESLMMWLKVIFQFQKFEFFDHDIEIRFRVSTNLCCRFVWLLNSI